jgi:hypothetical protein
MKTIPTSTCLAGLAMLLTLSSLAAAQTPTAPELLARAEAEALRLREPAQSAQALAEVAVAWRAHGEARWERTWAQALQMAERVPATEALAGTLTWRGLAVRLWPAAPEQARGLFDRALTQAKTLPYAAQKALALREIGRSLVGRDDALAHATLDQAAEAARTIEAPIFRAASLRDLAAAMAETDRAAAGKLFAEAAGALPPADPDENVQLARIEVAVRWAVYDLTAALNEADMIGDAPLREVCYRRLCEALASASPDQAMQTMARLHDSTQRALAMATLAAALADTQPETATGMARSALAAAEQMPAAERQMLEAEAAVALAPQGLTEAMTLLEQVDDETVAGSAFRRIVVRLARKQPAEALKVLEGVEDWQAREGTLMDILPQLTRYDAARALALVNELLSRQERIRALLTMAASLPDKEPQHT